MSDPSNRGRGFEETCKERDKTPLRRLAPQESLPPKAQIAKVTITGT